jgi:2-keto-4-pentenoate hydratase/2-oxohepta-3-ene-1,7-dioic acid hydratase in catechol pathway
VGKGHDTFAPQGPWIVPKEFDGDPMEQLHQTLSVDGEQMQEARAGDMIHSLWEPIEGIGTLRMPVVAGEAPPGETGASLPPVRTYRDPQ